MGKYNFSDRQDQRRQDRRPKGIPKRSKKRIESDKLLKEIRLRKIAEDVRCSIQGPTCTGFTQGLHHIQKSTPSNRLKEDNLVDCCNACNLYVELNLEWAKEKGLFKSKFKK